MNAEEATSITALSYSESEEVTFQAADLVLYVESLNFELWTSEFVIYHKNNNNSRKLSGNVYFSETSGDIGF